MENIPHVSKSEDTAMVSFRIFTYYYCNNDNGGLLGITDEPIFNSRLLLQPTN